MKKDYLGMWRIKEMELWDQSVVDTEGPGRMEFRKDGTGSIHFGAVRVEMDYKVEKQAGKEKIEFTFEGMDEGTPASGRGWAGINGQEMNGRIYFHFGDDSGFKAYKLE
jgi:hypothetical protein